MTHTAVSPTTAGQLLSPVPGALSRPSPPSQPGQPSAACLAAWRRLGPVFAQLSNTAADRENTGELDHAAVAALRDAGFTTLRVPQEYGGSGLSFEEASAFLVALGKAESNLAQALRIHWITVEDLLSRPEDQEHRDRWLTRIGSGAVVGNAPTEKNNTLGQTTTRLSTDPTRTDDDGEPVSLALPTDAPGVEIIDDWEGFGQRLTASGTTTFTDAPVPAEGVSPPGDGLDSGVRVAFGQALAQYVHLATLVGIGEAILSEAADYVRRRPRGFSHGAAELPKDDPQVLQVVGQISASVFGARASRCPHQAPARHRLGVPYD